MRIRWMWSCLGHNCGSISKYEKLVWFRRQALICVISTIWDLYVTDRQNPWKKENQSPSFSCLNHEGQLQRAADGITTTQTTKPSLQRIASSPSFYCHLVSLSVFSLSLSLSMYLLSLLLFILLCRLPPEWNKTCWCVPCILQRESWHEYSCNPSKANRNPACSLNSISDDWNISLWCDVLTQL